MSVTIYAQSVLKGKVVDQDSLPLPGVNVILKNESYGTVTDVNGDFTLRTQRTLTPKDKVVFSFMGYETKTLSYKEALSRTIIFTTTVMFDLEKIDRSLIFMPDVKSEDTATWWRILRAGYTAYGLNENLAVYRRPKNSLSSNKLEAVRRIWNLYRKQEGLSAPVSAYYLFFWALRATVRRL